MRNILSRLLAVCAALAVNPFPASAATDSELLEILTCTPKDTPGTSPAVDVVTARSTELNRDGPHLFSGPIRAGNVCVTQATWAAACGALAVSAEVCGGDYRAVVELVRRSRPQLAEIHRDKVPGIIAAYEDGPYSIHFYNGPPTFGEGPDPTSKTVLYMCGFRGSGAQ